LGALKRFVARRGFVENIYSDNGTNFVGAQNELKILFKTSEFNNQVLAYLGTKKIHWHLIPPRAPHFGEIWEAGVKSAKFHLRRVLGNAHLTYEEMYTLLTGIEACLNSRPLCPLTDDPNDVDVLTPGQFLIGAPLTIGDTGQRLHRGTDKSPRPLQTRRKAPTAFLAAVVSGISESAASKESMAASRDYVGATRDLGATSRQHTTAALEDGPSRGDPPRQGWGHQSCVRPGGEQGDQ
jgi:hypothetical protein